MIHVLPAPLSPATVLLWRSEELAGIIRYGDALVCEQATARAVEVWRGLYTKCRDTMATMTPQDRERLHAALKDAEGDATEAHRAAYATLHAMTTPFTLLAACMSRACCAG